MITYKHIFLIAFCLLLITACKSGPHQHTSKKQDTISKKTKALKDSLKNSGAGIKKTSDTIETELNAKSFIPANYTIDMQAKGDLNHDNVPDLVLVLLNKKDTTDLRTTLVLLQKDGAFYLDTKSSSAVEPKYDEDGYHNYGNEDLYIDSAGVLVFSMNDPGPSGNLESSYRYISNQLILTSISAYSMGAGSHTAIDIDPVKGIFRQTLINTMEENVPDKEIIQKIKPAKVRFDQSNPKEILHKAFAAYSR